LRHPGKKARRGYSRVGPFLLLPLARLTSDTRKMGIFANPAWLTGTAWTSRVQARAQPNKID
jgi:hypothetical protein